MEQSSEIFLKNNNLTNQNSLSHLLDFNDDYTDLTHCIQLLKYFNDDDFISKYNTNSCAIMSLNPNVSGGGQKSTTPSNYQHRIFPFNYVIVRFR